MTSPMPQDFRSFVIFAEMRTGSNLLEATMNGIKQVTCFGEAFNPYMLGWPDNDTLRGMTVDEREADPLKLLALLMDKPGHLPGFRYFHDHDPRVFDAIMDEPSCAKIILTRNPLDSYVSTRLAWETNQWKLNEGETATPAQIRFDGAEFRQMLDATEQFRLRVQRGLQIRGQSAFWLTYDDLRDAEVMTGMMHWLGRTDLKKVSLAKDQVPQNPREIAEKVSNFKELQDELRKMDPFALTRIPNFESSRGPAVPTYLAGKAGAGLIFMPVPGGPTEPVLNWLNELGGVQDAFTQNSLRQWKRAHPGHRGFTVLRDPVRRAWAAFEDLIEGPHPELRQVLREVHRVPLPDEQELWKIGVDQAQALFLAFLGFLRRNLSGQTRLPVQSGWATQTELVAGFARFACPDAILREDRLEEDLAWLASTIGLKIGKLGVPSSEIFPELLTDPEVTKAARQAYLRDYVTFGFDDPA